LCRAGLNPLSHRLEGALWYFVRKDVTILLSEIRGTYRNRDISDRDGIRGQIYFNGGLDALGWVDGTARNYPDHNCAAEAITSR